MSQNDEGLVNEIWAPESFENVFFSSLDSQRFLDSFTQNEIPTTELSTGFWHWRLDRRRPRREIMNATPAQLREWTSLVNHN